MSTLDHLQKRIKYVFSSQALIERAITHRSANKLNNERLEFLGDSLLGFIVAGVLMERFPDASEGDLSRMRSNLVNKDALADIAREIDLGAYIRLGTGELKSGGKRRNSILADAVEALIAAIYLDGGLAPCKEFVLQWGEPGLNELTRQGEHKDCKTRLQELLQAKGLPLPEYQVAEISGEAHDQTFTVQCSISLLDTPEQGAGKSKRLAEQEAAEKVLLTLGEQV
ncbi:MAG: ribonuclease III [Gammaproteobacteria bacterium]|nr:ribonuclease III [Gammaproteobacteria bacterium]